MDGYEVPEDYDYATGGFLDKDNPLTPKKLNRWLFEDNEEENENEKEESDV